MHFFSQPTENAHGKGQIEFQIVERRGLRKVYFSSLKLKVFIRDYRALYRPGDERPLTAAINNLLVQSKKEIIESITPSLEREVSKIVLEIANRIVRHFTYDELFPDKE